MKEETVLEIPSNRAISPKREFVLNPSEKQNKILSGWKKEWIELKIRLTLVKIAIRQYKNVSKAIQVLISLDKLRHQLLGKHRIQKIAFAGGKYYWDLYVPGFHSVVFERFFQSEMGRIQPVETQTLRFTNVFLSITKKCPLQCEHCFEWNNLNKKETLSQDNLIHILQNIQKVGAAQIQLTGGEPMRRMEAIELLLEKGHSNTDFWVLSSGFNFSKENAFRLKQAGLTGVVLSLDHYLEEEHNRFRHHPEAFEMVFQAVRNAHAAQLTIALSVCTTKEFTQRHHLENYMQLAKDWGISFVQFLEPKAVGHYEGMSVALAPQQEMLLEEFFLEYNFKKAFKDFPIIIYHGYYQRRIGCLASGNRNLYIDTDGDVHSCPFCSKKMGSALSESLDTIAERLQTKGCKSFNSFKN